MRRAPLLLALGWLATVSPTEAVVLNGGGGTQHFTDPGGGLPWSNVGTIGGATGVYLGNYGGNYWAITATHVGAGNLTLSGTTYNVVPGSAVRVLNNDNSVTDLTLFRIASNPGLVTLSLATSTPPASSTVQLVGQGLIETGAQRYWVDGGSTWVEQGTSTGANRSGYGETSGSGLRWGNALVTGLSSYDVGTGATTALVTEFVDASLAAMGDTGDSGGAMFYLNGGNWYLAGIMGAVGKYTNQPGSTAVFGDITAGGNIATYNSFITAAIPEPGLSALFVGSMVASSAWFSRRRQTS